MKASGFCPGTVSGDVYFLLRCLQTAFLVYQFLITAFCRKGPADLLSFFLASQRERSSRLVPSNKKWPVFLDLATCKSHMSL